MNKLQLYSLCVLTSCAYLSCSDNSRNGKEPRESHLSHIAETVSADEFVSWCSQEENQLSKTKTISEMSYKVMFLPPESMAYIELKAERPDIDIFRKVTESYKGMSYFNFRLQLDNGSGELLKYNVTSPAHYEERLKYVSFSMENDLYLVQANDTIYPGLYHFERAFEVVPFLTVMLAFDNKQFDREKEFTLVYNDKLFEKGLVKFNYQAMQLVDLPQVVQL